MANVFNKQSRLNTFTVADLMTVVSTKIRKVVFRPAAETQTAVLQVCDLNVSPDCDASFTGATVASTSIITAASGTPFSRAAVGE